MQRVSSRAQLILCAAHVCQCRVEVETLCQLHSHVDLVLPDSQVLCCIPTLRSEGRVYRECFT